MSDAELLRRAELYPDMLARLLEDKILLDGYRVMASMCLVPGTREKTLRQLDEHVTILEELIARATRAGETMQPPTSPPTIPYPGLVLWSNLEEDREQAFTLESMMYREMTVHVVNNDAEGFAVLSLKWNLYADQVHAAYGRELDAEADAIQFNLTTKATSRAQHFVFKVPPGVKQFLLTLSGRTAGKYTVSVTKR